MIQDQSGVCAYCESTLNGNYHVDHMIPLSRGGRNTWSNLAITCGDHMWGLQSLQGHDDCRRVLPSNEEEP